MKSSKLITVMITGALITATAATAFAAQDTGTDTVPSAQAPVLNINEPGQAELPELPEGALNDEDRPELPEDALNDEDRPELPEGALNDENRPDDLPEPGKLAPQFMNRNEKTGQYIPKLKPETKPEGEDMVPPEFEGIENIDTLGKPELPESAPVQNFGGEAPEDMPGDSAPMQNFGGEAPEGMPGESAPMQNFGGEAPEGMPGESAPMQNFGGEAPEGMPGESAPMQNFGGEAPEGMAAMN